SYSPCVARPCITIQVRRRFAEMAEAPDPAPVGVHGPVSMANAETTFWFHSDASFARHKQEEARRGKKKPRPRGCRGRGGSRNDQRGDQLPRFSAAPRISPSEAPESELPYCSTASFSSAISRALIDRPRRR